jgi:drug/metabolite transporter (DMT)-like permease
MYVGVILSLITALLAAAADALSKKASATQSIYMISLSRWVFALPILWMMTFKAPAPTTFGTNLFIAIAILAPLEMLAMILYIKAIANHDLSVTVPLLSLTPLFLLITGSVFLQEKITSQGIVGVCTVLSGIYIMNISNLQKGVLAPFKAVFQNQGSMLVTIVALIYTVTSTLGKKVVLVTGAEFFSFWYLCLLSIGVVPVMLFKGENPLGIFKNFKINLLIGTVVGIASYSQFTAYGFCPIAYVIAIKRLSILFSVILGRMIFHEQAFGSRSAGAALAFLGVVLLLWNP